MRIGSLVIVLLASCGARTDLGGVIGGSNVDAAAEAGSHVCRNGSVGNESTCVDRSVLDDEVAQACGAFQSREIFDAGGSCPSGQYATELYHCCPSACSSSVGQVNHGCEAITVAEGRAPALCEQKGMNVDYVHSYTGTDPSCGVGMTTTTYVSCCP